MARHRRTVTSGALLIYLLSAGVAALGGQGREPGQTPAPATAKPASTTPPDMSTIVERIQKRIDDEVGKPAAARAPKRPSPRTGSQTVAPVDRRIRLLWRVSLIWPAELAAEP